MDLCAQYLQIGGEIREAVNKVLASQHFVLGQEGAALEQEIAALCGVRHGIGVASGTDALILALRAVGVAAGDEVILPPFTFVATGSAVSATMSIVASRLGPLIAMPVLLLRDESRSPPRGSRRDAARAAAAAGWSAAPRE